MSNLKLLSQISIFTLASAALVSAPACAQETEVIIEPVASSIAADYAAADLDQDAALNADEFVTFAVMRAEEGDEAYKDIVLSGEYDVSFAARDADASGGLSAEELGHSEAPEMVEPEMLGDEFTPAEEMTDESLDAPSEETPGVN